MADKLSDTGRNEIKEVVKQAIKEWLTEQAAEFGWMSVKFLCALAVAVVLWLALLKSGWRPPQS